MWKIGVNIDIIIIIQILPSSKKDSTKSWEHRTVTSPHDRTSQMCIFEHFCERNSQPALQCLVDYPFTRLVTTIRFYIHPELAESEIIADVGSKPTQEKVRKHTSLVFNNIEKQLFDILRFSLISHSKVVIYSGWKSSVRVYRNQLWHIRSLKYYY